MSPLQHARCRVNLGLYFMHSKTTFLYNSVTRPLSTTVERALRDPHHTVTAVIYDARSKRNSKPTEPHGNASIDFTELCLCGCRQLHHAGEHQSWLGRSWLLRARAGSQSRQAVCAVPPCPAARLCRVTVQFLPGFFC